MWAAPATAAADGRARPRPRYTAHRLLPADCRRRRQAGGSAPQPQPGLGAGPAGQRGAGLTRGERVCHRRRAGALQRGVSAPPPAACGAAPRAAHPLPTPLSPAVQVYAEALSSPHLAAVHMTQVRRRRWPSTAWQLRPRPWGRPPLLLPLAMIQVICAPPKNAGGRRGGVRHLHARR